MRRKLAVYYTLKVSTTKHPLFNFTFTPILDNQPYQINPECISSSCFIKISVSNDSKNVCVYLVDVRIYKKNFVI